jgi:hypothetical protein
MTTQEATKTNTPVEPMFMLPTYVSVDIEELRCLLVVCESARDNAIECFNRHSEDVVVNPQKHEAVVIMFRRDIQRAEKAVADLRDWTGLPA